jgi:hypothetical protein
MDWFVLETPKLWGDYGDVLISGYYRREGDGPVELHRAGPFLPPLSMPWSSVGGWRVIVSDEFRTELMEAEFNELEFRSANKSRIIRLEWHLWNRSADAPPQYPDEGEPENYIWEQPHDESAANKMPDAWELIIPVSSVTYQDDPEDDGARLMVMENREYPRWFRTRKEWGPVVVSPSVRDWLESRIPEWVRFEPLHCKIA